MEHRPVSAGRTSPIHLAECRDRLLDALRGGTSRAGAAESIGCSFKTFSRYYAAHPGFAAKVEAAERGEDTPSESTEAAPMMVARQVVDAEPVDADACDVAKVRPPPEGLTGLEVFRDDLMLSIAVVVKDNRHPHFARVADLLFKALYGAELLRAMREAEREPKAAPPITIAAGRSRVLEAVTRSRQAE
jgi:hypothetical protein